MTDPISLIALGGSAVAISAIAARHRVVAEASTGRWLAALAVAVALYLLLGALAVTVGEPIALWSTWWVVPSAIVQLAALNVFPELRRWLVALAAVFALTVVVGTLFVRPERPFDGVAPAVPEAWAPSAVVDVATLVMFLAMLLPPVLVGMRAIRADRRGRVAGVSAAAAAAIPPLLVIVCVGLAVARDPGGVDPVFGSVGYLVALSLGCLVGAVLISLGSRMRPDLGAIRRLVGAVVGAYAVVGIALIGTWGAGVLAPGGTFAVVIAILAVTGVLAFVWWRVTARLLALTAERESETPQARLGSLSAREQEVLALVADGARDADIAAQLHLSPRTVEAHLRRIFGKLGLENDDGRNRRLLAARAYLEVRARS